MGSGAHVTTAGTWNNASDIAKKENFADLEYGLKEILKLNPFRYTYKIDERQNIGFIAQEMEQIIPEVLSGVEGKKGIAYGLIASVLVKGIQEQQQQIRELQLENAALKSQIEKVAKLEAKIEKLRQSIQRKDFSSIN